MEATKATTNDNGIIDKQTAKETISDPGNVDIPIENNETAEENAYPAQEQADLDDTDKGTHDLEDTEEAKNKDTAPTTNDGNGEEDDDLASIAIYNQNPAQAEGNQTVIYDLANEEDRDNGKADDLVSKIKMEVVTIKEIEN